MHSIIALSNKYTDLEKNYEKDCSLTYNPDFDAEPCGLRQPRSGA
jgi:hypothetical protein